MIILRIRVARNIEAFGLSPGIIKEQRLGVEKLMKNACNTLSGDLAGKYYPLLGMDENVSQQLVDDHLLFVTGDPNLTVNIYSFCYYLSLDICSVLVRKM